MLDMSKGTPPRDELEAFADECYDYASKHFKKWTTVPANLPDMPEKFDCATALYFYAMEQVVLATPQGRAMREYVSNMVVWDAVRFQINSGVVVVKLRFKKAQRRGKGIFLEIEIDVPDIPLEESFQRIHAAAARIDGRLH